MPETINNPRFRMVTMSLNADTIEEIDIINALASWDKGIKGSAYILHDKDVYLPREVKAIQKQYNELLAGGVQPSFEVPDIGEPKTPHWHILLHFGNSNRAVDTIANLFNTTTNMIQAVRGRDGFKHMLAYLTHITEKSRDKFQYEYDEVKGLRFPDLATFAGMENYYDFAEAYLNDSLLEDDYCVAVMNGKLTLQEVKEANPNYYLSNIQKLERARHEYINSLPTPNILTNFYVGPGPGVGQKGRLGKSVVSQLIALSHLAHSYPDVDFSQMTSDDLVRNGYLFYAGGDSVTLQDYDGQPIIIWDDITSENLLKTFGGSSRLFVALDRHPKPVAFNIKYGRIYLKNTVNIFNGIEDYDTFIKGLCRVDIKRYSSHSDSLVSDYTYTDFAQAEGRVPFFVSVTPDMIKFQARLGYLIGTSEFNGDFDTIYVNTARSIAEQGKLYENREMIGGPYREVEIFVKEHREKERQEALALEIDPDNIDEDAKLSVLKEQPMTIPASEEDIQKWSRVDKNAEVEQEPFFPEGLNDCEYVRFQNRVESHDYDKEKVEKAGEGHTDHSDYMSKIGEGYSDVL